VLKRFRQGDACIVRKLILKQSFILLVLLWLTACSSGNTSISLATIGANGPGVSGTVPAGATFVLTMAGIYQGDSYTIQTTIPVMTLSTGSVVSDGTLTVNIYSSESAYTSNLPPEPITVAPSINNPGVYEAFFVAASSGNYVAVVEGDSSSFPGQQFFYDFRIMSASPGYLATFATPTILASNYGAYLDYLQVYNGGNVSPSGTYSLNLVSAGTTTGYYPQLFLYNDATLLTSSLLYSAVTTSYNFVITDFTTNPPTVLPTDPNNNIYTGVTITGIPFTNSGPYIVVRGIYTSFVYYNMTVGP
jgi:hypothetical protein